MDEVIPITKNNYPINAEVWQRDQDLDISKIINSFINGKDIRGNFLKVYGGNQYFERIL